MVKSKNKNDQKKNLKKCKDDDLFVSILMTESTTSLLKMNLPHVENMHPDNSKIFVISPAEYYNRRLDQNSSGTLKENGSFTGSSIDREPGPSKIESLIGVNKNVRVQTSISDHLIYGTHLKIASDVGLFKSNFSSRSSCMYEGCDSTEDLENSLNKEHKSAIFETRNIKPLPLLTARTTAHSNKLNINSTDVYVSLLDASLNSTEYICRICHGGESLDDLLTPCRCRGTVALVHLKCLERWLKDSQHSSCELCQHHYKIVRKPKYTVPWSIPAYLRDPGPQLKDVLIDLFAFAIYTPSAVASTYMLMMLCESLVKSSIVSTGTFSSHILAFSAVFGMAAIDFTYSSWLLYTCQRHVESWSEWYNHNTTLKVVLSPIKLRPHKKSLNVGTGT